MNHRITIITIIFEDDYVVKIKAEEIQAET